MRGPRVRFAIGIVCAILVVFGAIVLPLYRWRQNRTFDAARWRSAPAMHSDYRAHAVDDLLHRYRLRGMSRGDVVQLLGLTEPSQMARSNPEAIVYWLGAKSDNFYIDDFWLIINFTNDDRVKNTVVTTD